MTKEEYKKNAIRMWDSLRTKHKGEENCLGVICDDCPLYNKACGSFYVFEALELIEQWAKEHKIVTNADKFKEVFGVDAPMNRCIKNYDFCVDCEYYEFGSEHGGCKANEKFWNAEYKEPADKDEQNLELKQEPVLDKIRNEIEEIETYDGIYVDRAFVLQIIDKYKAESEE